MNSHRAPGHGQHGFSFAELAFGLLILGIAATVLVNHLTVNYQSTALERDRVFAYSKAQAILAEIQGYVDRGEIAAAVDLDTLDDGIIHRPTLTITKDATGNLVLPDHVLSGNTQRNNEWLWSRRITVMPFQGQNNRNVRYVTVHIFKRDYTGRDLHVADLSSVINSSGAAFPTTQVFDMYLLAVENIPGWWVYMDSIRPFMESTITDLETRNPGLSIRTHWITKASYGRNQAYRPYVNDAADSNQDIPEVYYYPGRMPGGSASTFYYVPDNFRAHVNLDGNDLNGYDPDLNKYPYALADFWNHAMRYPDEVAFHTARVAAIEQREAAIAAARAASAPPPPALTDMSKEPTLRMFLEDLNTNPAKYRNALIVNLHGELLPMPPLHNSSDPAREPGAFPDVRVVTHPEELYTLHNNVTTNPVRLRVYAFTSNAANYTAAGKPPLLGAPIAVEIMGVDLRSTPPSTHPIVAPAVLVENLKGGVLLGGVPNSNVYGPFAASKWESSPPSNPLPPVSNEMYYRVEYVDVPGQEKFSRILLFNTPVVCTQVGTQGLFPNERSRLYQMEYVPSCCEAARDFSRNLSIVGDGPKNTARWRITLPSQLFTNQMFVKNDGNHYNPSGDVLLRVRTRIWTGANPANSGTFWPPADRNQPDNLSVTYAWWADSPNDVPITERSQFNGDPRHNPYKDLCKEVVAGDRNFPNGYNWFHDAINNSGENSRPDYPSLDTARLFNRWKGRMFCDVPRYMELLRRGLTASRCVYTTLTGFSYYYMGLGNEVGYDDANGYPNSIPCNLRPMGFPNTTGFVNTITGARTLVRGSGANGSYWVGLPWLGELYPDVNYAQWSAVDVNGNQRGNLAAGTTANTFRQGSMAGTYGNSGRTAYGTLLSDPLQRTQEEGCTSLFNIGTSASTFHHLYSSGNGTLTGAGPQIAANYHFNMPASAPISRPFSLASNASGGVGDEFTLAPYGTTGHCSASLMRTYYNHPTGYTGSGLVKLLDNSGTNAAYIVVNGIDKTVDSGSAFIARFSILSLVHSFFESGDLANVQRIQQPARVEIESPTDITELQDPVNIPVIYHVTWTRWDGRPYTTTSTATEQESQLEYVIMYSNDGGTTWRHVQDDTVATPGSRPAAAYLTPDAGNGQETYTWPVPPASFPEGSYLLLIECYRLGSSIHYSFHESKLFIKRGG
jgi:hypothetical protein